MSSLAKKSKRRLALWTLTVRDSFVVLLPLTFMGVVVTLLVNVPFPAVQRFMAWMLGAGWRALMDSVANATYGVFGLALAVVVAIRLTRRLGAEESDEGLPEPWVGMAALVNFMLCLTVGDAPTMSALGRDSMWLGLSIGLATPELLRPLAKIFRVVPDYDSDQTFYCAIRMTPPLIILSIIVMLGAKAAAALPSPGMHWLAALPAIHTGIDADWLLSLAAVSASQLLWFIGIHGNMVLDQQAQALFGVASGAYSPALAWRPLLGVFGMMGGSGATLGLVLALFIVAREGPFRRLAAASVLPSLFNISELLIFGLPIALNPIFLWPFLLAPLALTLMALTAVHTGFLPLLNVEVPWTTPPLMSGYLLTGSWRGPALQVLCLLVSTLIYLPFVRRAEAGRARAQTVAFDATIKAIANQGQPQTQAVPRKGELGLVARGLFAALTRDLGGTALTLEFQPKHDHRGVAVGVEALLRWRHHRHGPVRADVAVTLAEEGGLIRSLGAWVMEEACARKAQWNALGLSHITMAINVSPLQLDDPQLPALLARCLDRYRLAPGEIELEITESQAIPVRQVVGENLALIVAMGVSLAMDDFGMGYSSLLHMRRFSIHSIKIDGSLTRDVLTNPISRDIIHTIAALGHARHVEVIAEFVETAEQRDALAALGCGVFQGYFYSPALPSAACVEYLLANGARIDDAAPLYV